jgi:hypothetical protein
MVVQPCEEMLGINEAWVIENDVKIMFFVSPAVYELLQYDDVKEQVMKDIKVIDVKSTLSLF